jgi:glycerol-3-phosphate O-acyltransferase
LKGQEVEWESYYSQRFVSFANTKQFGIFKIILDSIVTNGRIKDCIIVPMSIGYDKVIESSAYVDELLGTPKEKETLMKLISNFQIASLKWGRIDVRFAEPFLLLEYIQKQGFIFSLTL